jgi:hypothetical protein
MGADRYRVRDLDFELGRALELDLNLGPPSRCYGGPQLTLSPPRRACLKHGGGCPCAPESPNPRPALQLSRGTYHGTEVAVKIIKQSRLAGVHSSSNLHASGTGLGLHKQNIHDAIELVASVSMSHINIVQVCMFCKIFERRCRRCRLLEINQST